MNWLRNNWFLLALIALALIAIPGAILVALRLFDWDTEINDWLQNNLSISYELRVAPWLAVVLLFLPIVLVILYFLRLKRKPIQVPSTFLWKKSVEDLHVNSLFQWLRNNVLLLLQLLVLLFLIYSVLGLRFHGNTKMSQHYILMIDNSASMSAKDVAPDRLTWAKVEALKEINAAADNDFGMVIVFNSKATTLQTYTNDKEKLREAVASIKPTERPTRIEEALAPRGKPGEPGALHRGCRLAAGRCAGGPETAIRADARHQGDCTPVLRRPIRQALRGGVARIEPAHGER